MEGKATGSPGFFSYIIGAVDPETGSGWGVEEIWAESSVLVVAGKYLHNMQIQRSFELNKG
jgi:sugar phosphate permease